MLEGEHHVQELLKCVPHGNAVPSGHSTGPTALEDYCVPRFCHQKECFKERNLGVVIFLWPRSDALHITSSWKELSKGIFSPCRILTHSPDLSHSSFPFLHQHSAFFAPCLAFSAFGPYQGDRRTWLGADLDSWSSVEMWRTLVVF